MKSNFLVFKISTATTIHEAIQVFDIGTLNKKLKDSKISNIFEYIKKKF